MAQETDYKQIFSVRLKNAREMRGMSMADLCGRLDNSVSRQAIYKYENAKMLPGTPLLIELSRALEVAPDYFFRPFNVRLSGIEFRKKTRLGKKEIKSIQMAAVDSIEKYVEIRDICAGDVQPAIQKNSELVSSDKDVQDLVERLRERWGLGNQRIANVIVLLESLGVMVIEVSAKDSFDGLSGYANGIPVVVINKAFSPERKRFTALHEMGHLLLSFPEGTDERRIESLCNLYASEMLLPSSVFRIVASDAFKGVFSLRDLAGIQEEYGISIDALIYKACKLSMISEKKHGSYHVLKNTRPAFREYAERSRIQNETCSKYEDMVYKAYTKELISASKAATLLSIPMDEVAQRAMVV